jgi:predicted RNA-binding Zn ribbon-like protein
VSDVEEAPGKLRFVGEFANTLDVDDDSDGLARPADLAAWLADHGLARSDLEVGPADLSRAVELREALRAALLANNAGEPMSDAVIATLNRIGRRARLVLRFDESGEALLEPVSDDVDAALGGLLAIVHDAMETGQWPRLKVCRSDDCLWAFYDHSKNRSRHWCSMESCGSQAKARSYRRRKAAADTGSAPAAGKPETKTAQT